MGSRRSAPAAPAAPVVPAAPGAPAALPGHAELVALYINGYPEGLIHDQVELFAYKLRSPGLAAFVAGLPAPHTREHLRLVLERCTLRQIGFVGW